MSHIQFDEGVQSAWAKISFIKYWNRTWSRGKLEPGTEIAIKIDQTLTQDATGTMTYLQFEAMDVPRVKTELSVSYVDHNTLQDGFENADDHRYLQTVASKYGIHYSKAGNGICHQVHLERFGRPGKTLLGSDSHTPTGGGIGMIAIGAGGLDVAVAMGGGPFYLTCPKVVKINLSGKLRPWVSAKDVILTVLKRAHHQGQCRHRDRIRRRRDQDAFRARACDHHEHGRGTRCDHLGLSER